MNIILGASGRVGSSVVDRLVEYGHRVRAVVRDEKKSVCLRNKGVEIAVADYFDASALSDAFRGGCSVFLLTPENPQSNDLIKDTAVLLENYRHALISSGVKTVVGLSSSGARHPSGTGNLEASYMLEHAFEDMDLEKIFVRPGYYYSNWLGSLDAVNNDGVLPTFFPIGQKIAMIAPEDVGFFIADIIAGKIARRRIFEIAGPEFYSPADIAAIFADVLGKNVNVFQIQRSEWQPMLEQAGFSVSAAVYMALMADAVISGKTNAEYEILSQPTGFADYLKRILCG